MNETAIFAAALGLPPPWRVTNTVFDGKGKELHIHIDFDRGSRFKCPTCNVLSSVFDSEEKSWRHLDFFQHKAFLHARVPRSDCKEHGPLTVELPWARPGSGFTLLFEALILTLAKSMPILALARLIGEHDTKIWRIVRHHVDEARKDVNMSAITKVGMDETSVRKHHKYLTIFADIDTSHVLFATPGKDGGTILPFIKDFCAHGGSPSDIREVSVDMSPAFIRGIEQHLPKAKITFDKFHVTKLITDAVNAVRKREQQESPAHYALLKGSRFALLKNSENMPSYLAERLDEIMLSKLNLKSARAWRLKEGFREAYSLSGKLGERQLHKWCKWAMRSRLEPMIDASKTIVKHWSGVIGYFKTKTTNAIMESINAIFQAARAKARGYRNPDYAIAILYLLGGGLNLPDLNKTHPK